MSASRCCDLPPATQPQQRSLFCYPYPQSLLCNEHLGELAGLSRLEQLSLRGCSRLTGAGLTQLGCLRRSLTMLNLSNCTGLTGGRDWWVAAGMHCGTKVLGSRDRQVDNSKHLVCQLLPVFASTCAQWADIHACSQAGLRTHHPAMHFAPGAPPADDCLAALAAALPQLATLNLQGCSGLGDEAISHLINMPHLRQVADRKAGVGWDGT